MAWRGGELGDPGAGGHGADTLLSPDEAGRMLRVAVKTLEKWRSARKGPPWVQIGRRIAYRREAVLEFVQSQETSGRKAATAMDVEVTSRPYWKDRTRQHVDIMFVHPNTERPLRKRIVAPAGMDANAATEWGRGQAMRLYMEACKSPRHGDEEREAPREPQPGVARERAAAKSPVLSEFWEVFTARYVAGTKHATRLNYEQSWRNHIRGLLGERRLDELDRHAFELLQTALEAKKLAVASQKVVVRKLLRCLKWAVQHQFVKAELPKLHFARERKAPIPVYTRDQWEAFARAAVDPRDRVLALLLTDGVLRIGEVAGLRWQDIDLAQGYMRIERNVCKGVLQSSPKGEIGDVPLSPRLVEALREHGRRADPESWVLARAVDGEATYSSDESLRHRARVLQECAQIPVWGPHRVRHSVLTFLAESGVTPYALQAFARHEDMTTTMHYYLHLDRRKLAREAVDTLAGNASPPRRPRPVRSDDAKATSGSGRQIRVAR